MGYQRKPTLYQLKWEDEPGLEVSMRSAPVAELLKLMRLAGSVQRATENTIDAAAQAEELFRLVAGNLVVWNLEDEEGTAVPATFEGACTQDMDFMLKIVGAWQEAMADVNRPLRPSSNGSQSLALEQSIPMVPSSPNPSS